MKNWTMTWDDIAKAKEGLGPPAAGRYTGQDHLSGLWLENSPATTWILDFFFPEL